MTSKLAPTSDDVMPLVAAVAATAPKRRYARLGTGVGILAVIALGAALYLARAFFVPLLIGILANCAFHPLVD